MDWIFNGIGTQIISLIVGIVMGIIGEKTHQKYIHKVKQKSGDNSIQVNSSVGGDNSGNTHIIRGDMNVFNANDEFDIRQIFSMIDSEIEKVIKAGNNATTRKWCLELIRKNKSEDLIIMCVNKMDNDKEKFNLLKSLVEQYTKSVERDATLTKYLGLIEESITNNGILKDNAILTKIIKIYIDFVLEDRVHLIFKKIDNKEYMFKSLKLIYSCNKSLFYILYKNGSCFNGDNYIQKMEKWICEQKVL